MSELIDTRQRTVTIKTRRGNLRVGPRGRIDGLWQIISRELRTNQEVRELAGGITRHTLKRWRALEQDPFPPPVWRKKVSAETVEFWSRTQVEEWIARRQRQKQQAES